jgi:hypothetical protein
MNNYADLRADREAEILSQLGGAQAFLASITYLNVERTRYTLELLGAVQRVATFVEMRVKHSLAVRRGIEFSSQIQPMIAVPTHAAFPSGHATETFAMAYVLWRLLKAAAAKALAAQPPAGNPAYANTTWARSLMRLAARVAINRQVAGVHTPVESAAGAMLGLTLGNYLVARFETNLTAATPAAPTYTAWQFDGTAFPQAEDFNWTALYDISTGMQKAAGNWAKSYSGAKPVGVDSPVLHWLWNQALDEWN